MSVKSFIQDIRNKIRLSQSKLPKHIAITIRGTPDYSKKHNLSAQDANSLKFLHIKNSIKTCIRLNIPIITFYLHGTELKDDELDFLAHFFTEIKNWEELHSKQAKISVIGKWYSLSDRIVEPIKAVLESTKDYDRFFVNFCINYNGQDEIADACKLIAKQVELGKLAADSIDRETIKENIYTSYFLPPELMIITGGQQMLDGFLLWDSSHAKVYFSEKQWPEFGKDEFLKAVEWYQKG